jgi:hypothetical protein
LTGTEGDGGNGLTGATKKTKTNGEGRSIGRRASRQAAYGGQSNGCFFFVISVVFVVKEIPFVFVASFLL